MEECTGCTNFLVVIDCPYNVNLANLVVLRFFVDLIISIFKVFPVVGFVRFVPILASLLPGWLCVELRFAPKREVLRRGENRDIRRKTSTNRKKIQPAVQTTLHVASTPGLEPRPHWWKLLSHHLSSYSRN